MSRFFFDLQVIIRCLTVGLIVFFLLGSQRIRLLLAYQTDMNLS